MMTPIDAFKRHHGHKRLILFLATGFGSGLVPRMPGTAGSILAALMAWMAAWLFEPWAVITVALTGIFICGYAAKLLGHHDHGAIVWDEWSGLWLTYALISPDSIAEFFLGLFFFRVFDILKPWPIRPIEKKIAGGLGIMLDDWLAGLIAALCCWGIMFYAF